MYPNHEVACGAGGSPGEITGEESTGGSGNGDRSVAVVNVSDIPGTAFYCSEDAEAEIGRRIAASDVDEESGEASKEASDGSTGGAKINFLGSGDYHYMTKILTDRIFRPFSLLQIDNHPDMQPPAFGDILSCGGWVRKMLETNQFLRKVAIMGIDPELAGECGGFSGRVSVLTRDDLGGGTGCSLGSGGTLRNLGSGRTGRSREEAAENGNKSGDSRNAEEKAPERRTGFLSDWLDNSLGDNDIYISIDKDVLSPEFAKTDWSQGSMTLGLLSEILQKAGTKRRVLGVDICGALPEEKGATEEDLKINVSSDAAILRTISQLFKKEEEGRGKEG